MATLDVLDGYDDELAIVNSLKGQFTTFTANAIAAIDSNGKLTPVQAAQLVPAASDIIASLLGVLQHMNPPKRDRLLFVMQSGVIVVPA